MVKWIIGAIIGVIVVIGAFLVIDPSVSKVQNNADVNNTSLVDNSKISIKILGAVVNPGTYTIYTDSTLGDLIDKAGGLVSSADTSCFDQGISVNGHDSFYIPFISGFSQECQMSDVEKININKATQAQLASINGISSSIAANIVAYRDENGPFTCLEDLINVSGIGVKTFEKIRDYITLR